MKLASTTIGRLVLTLVRESSSTTSLDDADRFRVAVSFEGEIGRAERRGGDLCEPAERKCINEVPVRSRFSRSRPSRLSGRGGLSSLSNESSWKTRSIRENERKYPDKWARSKRRVLGLCLGTESAFDTSEIGGGRLRVIPRRSDDAWEEDKILFYRSVTRAGFATGNFSSRRNFRLFRGKKKNFPTP